MQEITLLYLRDIHRVSLPNFTLLVFKQFAGKKKTRFFFFFLISIPKSFFIYGVFYRSTKGAFGKLELPRQHSHYSGREQATSGDPDQWRTSTQSGVDEGRKGRL